MFGVTRDEYALFFGRHTAPETLAEAERYLTHLGRSDLAPRLQELYQPESRAAMVRLGSDTMFFRDTIGAALAQCCHGRTYVYRMDFAISPLEQGFGAVHAIDIEFALGSSSPHESAMCNPEDLAARWDVCAEFGRTMHRAIVQFAKTGCPDGAFSVEWPAFDAEKRQVLCMNLEPRVVSDPFGASLQFWLDASDDG